MQDMKHIARSLKIDANQHCTYRYIPYRTENMECFDQKNRTMDVL